MKLSERLQNADRETLERALCHAVALAASLMEQIGTEGETCRTITGVCLDVGARDWSPPFAIDGQSLTGHAGEAFLRRLYTDIPPNPASEHRGV